MATDQQTEQTGGRGFLPVGIPLGKLPAQPGSAPRYLIRRGGEFFMLEVVEYAIFCAAQASADVVGNLSQNWGQNCHEIAKLYQSLIERRFVLRLSGDQNLDWSQLGPLRVIPRCIIVGSIENPVGAFALLTPDGQRTIVLDAVAFALWSRFDGTTPADVAVAEVSQDGGFTEGFLRERVCNLICSGMRAGLLMLDSR